MTTTAATMLLARLDGVQGRGPRWRAICPAHESKHRTRTLAIFEADDGRLLVKCHAGCDIAAIMGAVGLDLSDLFPPREALGDEQSRRGPRKPWSARDVVRALEAEAMVAWVLLADMAAGRPITAGDRKRAGVAADRCAHLIRELADAA
jgi:hypothetical protein